jgi:hypothetical protein
MLPEELLLSLRQWWTVRPTRYDVDVPVSERWLFPGHRRGQHLTTRHLSRIFHESAAAAGITKRVRPRSRLVRGQIPAGWGLQETSQAALRRAWRPGTAL